MKDGSLSPICENCPTNGEPFFCWLPADGADESDSTLIHPKGTVLFDEGQPPRGVYLLRDRTALEALALPRS